MIRSTIFVFFSIITANVLAQIDTLYSDQVLDSLSRQIVYRPQLPTSIINSKSGSLTFKLCVNKVGEVVFAEPIQSETTITKRRALHDALAYVKELRYEAVPSLQNVQCTKYEITIDNLLDSPTKRFKRKAPLIRKNSTATNAVSQTELTAPSTIITIKSDGSYWIRGKKVSLDRIERVIQELHKNGHFIRNLIITPDPEVARHHIDEILTMVSKYNIETILTNP